MRRVVVRPQPQQHGAGRHVMARIEFHAVHHAGNLAGQIGAAHRPYGAHRLQRVLPVGHPGHHRAYRGRRFLRVGGCRNTQKKQESSFLKERGKRLFLPVGGW